MQTIDIKQLLATGKLKSKFVVKGWVRTKRMGKRISFITMHDGTCQAGLQVMCDAEVIPQEVMAQFTTGVSLEVKGELIDSRGTEQRCELQAHSITCLGEAPVEAYPLQPKQHSMEFLRSIQHLRFRTQTFGAIFRIRHHLSRAIHRFFSQRGFFHLHSPILTSIDAEGAGELFRVTAEGHKSPHFFGHPVYLSVSGQLAGEAAAMGLGKVYTFGPTFRAENSNTTRHLAEFWMVEPEMCFYDLQQTIGLATDMLHVVANDLFAYAFEEISFLEQRAKRTGEESLRKRIEGLERLTCERLTYTAAIDILASATQKEPTRFQYPIKGWGEALQTEHERYLTEVHFEGRPVVVTDYPREVKAFYMRQNKDGKTVATMDMLLPGIGEIIGGSQREERLPLLEEAMVRKGMEREAMEWYLDTRRFGSVVHSGFGLGFERLLQYITGMHNIRDVTAFPRTPGQARC